MGTCSGLKKSELQAILEEGWDERRARILQKAAEKNKKTKIWKSRFESSAEEKEKLRSPRSIRPCP